MDTTELGVPLPQGKVPSLHPFKNRSKPIKFVRLLSSPEAEGDGHVFEVVIAEKTYALKMFRFYSTAEDRIGVLGEKRRVLDKHGVPGERKYVVPDEVVEAHMDPFYAECRAYGRLIEENLNGRVAVRCHGYMGVPSSYEHELGKRFKVYSWNRPMIEDSVQVSKRLPFRAIVKDLIRKETRFTKREIRKIAIALKMMHRVGVYAMDVRADNYKGGLLVDFSVSHTVPHVLFNIRPAAKVRDEKEQDGVQFDTMLEDMMMDDEHDLTWETLVGDDDYCDKLRSSPSKVVAQGL